MMLLLLSLLLALLPSAVGNTTRCNSSPPGINKLRRGVDITTLDLLPLDLSTTSQDGFRKPVMDFTCSDAQTWTDRRGNTYDLPDQIWDILNVGGGWSSTNVKIFKSYNEIKKTMASSVNLGLTFLKGMFSASGSYKKMQHTISQKSSYIEEVSTYDAALKVDLAPGFALTKSRYLKLMSGRLPKEFTTNPAAYFSFIKYFGTHYFTSGNFGGTIRMNIETKSSYYNGKSSRDVQAQAKASFLKIVKIGGSGSSSRYQEDENFRKSSTESLRYFGGDTNLLDGNNGLTTWQPTVITNPWLFSGELASITELIDDASVKSSLERATKAYLNKAFLRELERLLKAFATSSKDLAHVQTLTTRINAELLKEEPDQTEVDNLGKAVQGDFSVPTWFSSDLKLCYNWYADGDGGQCGGGAANTLCAKTGQMTSYYRDDSDSRSGGCQMRWGLMPTVKTQPSWFTSVQICFRWYADGDAGQCQSARGSYCAAFGQYTSHYRDDTDRRNGGCQMSWQLKVPTTSPRWLKNAKLCYNWHPDGDGGQCGGGAHRNLCAAANQWTSYYRDDSDRRSGGCQMQWGIKLE